MPELPEVQTITDDLNRKIKGAVILDFWTDWKKGIKMDLNKFRRQITGKRILEAKRRGKNLLVFLSGKLVIHIHLKMTGHLLVKAGLKDGARYFEERVNQYIHHIWHLKKSGKKFQMDFSDLRKFGKIRLLTAEQLASDKEFLNLGAEPLAGDFSLNKFKKILERKNNWFIRDILMDQSLIAGIGNIYVSEILFEAGVMPKRRARELADNEVKKIFSAIKKVLKKAVALRGTSDSDYRDTSGAKGGFQEVLKVYNQEGKKCARRGCAGIVKREKHKQRSAFFCEGCQR